MKTRRNKTKTVTESFDVMVEGKPVTVKATQYETHTTEARYRVSINGSPIYIFGWDSERNRLAAIDSATVVSEIPEPVELAIGQQLHNRMAA